MHRYAIYTLLVVAPGLSYAGSYDYYECVGPDGVSHSIERCQRGEESRRIEDNLRPVSFKLGEGRDALIRIPSGPHGQYYATATINGVPVRVLIDTGASFVSVSPAAARRAGLDRQPFDPAYAQTANGVAPVRNVVADEVELGGERVRKVAASINGKGFGNFDVLLGMSFLNHFEVSMGGGVLTLRRK